MDNAAVGFWVQIWQAGITGTHATIGLVCIHALLEAGGAHHQEDPPLSAGPAAAEHGAYCREACSRVSSLGRTGMTNQGRNGLHAWW